MIENLKHVRAPNLIKVEANRHLHIYQRSAKNKDIYKCIDPDCTHYTQKEMIEGKRVRCGKCKEQMIVPKDQLRNKLVVCVMCTKSRKGEKRKKVMNILDKILG